MGIIVAVELIRVVLEQLNIVKVYWSCPLALLCKVQRLPLANRVAILSEKPRTQNTYITYCLELVIIFYPAQHFQHLLYFILINDELGSMENVENDLQSHKGQNDE